MFFDKKLSDKYLYKNVRQYILYDRVCENAEEYGHWNIIQWWHEFLVRPHHHLPSTLSSRHGADRNHHHVQGKRCFARGLSAPKSSRVE
jgi:hypothetical protein